MRSITIFLILILLPSSAFPATINAGRTSGVAPLAVHLYDSDVPASNGSAQTFHTREYVWQFGDPGSGTWSLTTGKSKNIAYGPVAFHVYETPGTYTIKLIVRDASGVIGTDTETITVTDPDTVFEGSNTICYSDTSSFTGCPIGATHVQTTDLSTIELTDGKRHLFRRGGNWTLSSDVPSTDGPGPTIVGAFGTGDNPAFVTAGNASIVDKQDKQNWRLMDLTLTDSLGTHSAISGIDLDFQHWLVMRVHITGYEVSWGWSHWNDSTPMTIDQMAIVECTFQEAGLHCFYGGAERLAIIGSIFHESGDSHLVRVWQAYRSVIQHNRMDSANIANSNGRLALKLHGPDDEYEDPEHCTPTPGTGCLENYTAFTVVSDNIFGSSGPWPVAIAPQSEAADSRLSDIIFERNYLVRDWGYNNVNVNRHLHVVGDYISVRNNIFDATGASEDYVAVVLKEYTDYVDHPTGNRVMNNTIYRSDASTDWLYGISIGPDVIGTTVKNNLVSFAAATGPHAAVNDLGTGTIASHNFEIDDPLFVDPDNVTPLDRDFSLQSGSAAIDAGTTVFVLDDYPGARRVGLPYDAGAYEYGAPFEDIAHKNPIIPNLLLLLL